MQCNVLWRFQLDLEPMVQFDWTETSEQSKGLAAAFGKRSGAVTCAAVNRRSEPA